ncbi:MAG: hypothetical protein A2Y62_00335 [Candidatus Fischerbacteria bacterium RBG_13_37_8]|uniref:Sigma-54 factor interaction domain-containing protein n=1 Tax=Candidatus Fischerbacteria bacterium RBG_13_37_8 TaxID=1817863 RepID=A0A1F5VXD5_9BACT|nr:MAG: hypothetical protein A2Y62_00335 [Candidatus Fischerbacteria bacterium RBG_13_37_8]
MLTIGCSTNYAEMMLSVLYAVQEHKPCLLYGEPATGKYSLAAFMFDLRGAQNGKFYNMLPASKLTKLESLLDKKDSVLFLNNFQNWPLSLIRYINQNRIELLPWLIVSISHANFNYVVEFFSKHEIPLEEFHVVYIPSLRERIDDLLLLAEAVINETAKKYKIPSKQFSRNAKSFIVNYPWYGNFAEFNTILKKALFSSKGHSISEQDMYHYIKVLPEAKERAIADFENYLKEILKDFKYADLSDNSPLYSTVMEEADRVLVDFAMKQAPNLKKACQLLGLSTNTFRKKYIKYYNVK